MERNRFPSRLMIEGSVQMKRFLFPIILISLFLCVGSIAFSEAERPSAAIRHGTLIVRVPDSYIAQEWQSRAHETDIWGTDEISIRDSWEIDCVSSSILSDEDLFAFRYDMMVDNSATYTGITTVATPKDWKCLMCFRHVGDAWYSIVRLKEEIYGEQELWISMSSYDLVLADGELEIKPTAEMVFPETIKIENADEQTAAWRKGQVAMYDTIGAHFMVLDTPHNRKTAGKTVDLYIGSDRIPLWNFLMGYVTNDKKDIYCAVLADNEVDMLEDLTSNGSNPVIKLHDY